MALPMGGRKPKKIIWREGVGDSSTLNTNPWQSKDIQYRYRVESDGLDSTPESNVSNAEVAAGIDAIFSNAKRNQRINYLNQLKGIESHLNNLASQSLFYEPMRRALARYGFAWTEEEQGRFVRYDINPILQYERLLIECSELWEVATNKPEIEFRVGNAVDFGVGINHGAYSLIEVHRDSLVINANNYWAIFKQRLHVQEALSKLISALSSQVWVKLNPDEKKVFAASFINNVHRLSKSPVQAGVFKNIIEDELISSDEALRSVGALLHNCYVFGQREGLVISEPLPSYDLEAAEAELLDRHIQVTMPHLSSYVSRRLSPNFRPEEVYGYFSEIVDYLGGVRISEAQEVGAQDLLEHSVLLISKLERVVLLITAFFEAVKETTLERDRLVTLLFAVRDLRANYRPVVGADLSSDVKLVFGGGYYELGEEISFIQSL